MCQQKEIKMATTSQLKSLIPNYCDTITTKEVASMLDISTKEAYNLCTEAETEGWLYKFGYKVKGGFEDVQESKNHPLSLTWQRSQG